jgi:anhydro-N-acetylmuramic acid kinase
MKKKTNPHTHNQPSHNLSLPQLHPHSHPRRTLSQSRTLSAVGIMSGTSLDACDFVLCSFQVKPGKKSHPGHIQSVTFQDHVQRPLNTKLQNKTWSLVQSKKASYTTLELAELHQQWGEYYAKEVLEIQKSHHWSFDLVGLHGQTILHQGGRFTWQLGSPYPLVSKVGVPVVADFRSLDVTMGYQGAPLAPLFHKEIQKHNTSSAKKLISFHNLGGLSNLTLVEKGLVIQAFDTGPANVPMDTYIQRVTKGRLTFDQGGALAAQGEIIPTLEKKLKSHPFFKLPPPKSADRQDFGGLWLEKILQPYGSSYKKENVLATLTQWVAWSIAKAYQDFENTHNKRPESIYFCGGGALNSNLLDRLQKLLPYSQVLTTQDLQWPVFTVEAACFAYLAVAQVLGIQSHLKNITGNPNPITLGTLYKG